ncbi:helix-turn-helix transcriptional regulator [Profundibacterium mesophilum]|uniref:BirA family transcriptional regulator biotin operon repressor biotin-acetyl-CoA-carboxylase ligase n=1 Tax=Profundibacterium mesophilum KAUST100406-0324 TaxID=1037889 RepID=A0A921NRQ3_9RHOB|nr:WYL domain-containing protein [Profundibacterium mesophilum]KAF0675124.1 BirA family transcriptional regulator biotin operon repressor biotin-acetyl-CoA-carboxylase ligase [Profundibacterium mesophilum KAUST100406-0324]
MRRTDRLYEIIQVMRDGRVHRAEWLARRLGVSLRTIYRDLETLMGSGIPVEGRRGAGYQMTAPVTLPPLNLSLTELEALHLGLAVVGETADPELSDAAARLSAKIDAVLPEDRSSPPKGFGFAVYPFADAAYGFRHLPQIRAAIRARQKLSVEMAETGDAPRTRRIRPLQLDYWGRLWTVTVWCETTGRFAVLRADRIETLKVLPQLFVEEPGKTLSDYREAQAARKEG